MQAPPQGCSKGWDTSSWVTGSTAGSRCTSARYNSPYDCPSVCGWSDARLTASSGSEQCAGVDSPVPPPGAAGTSTMCLLHPPCAPGGSGGSPTSPDGPCYCCNLALDASVLSAASGGSKGVGEVPTGQLWVFFLGQLGFLIWVLLLTRSQVGRSCCIWLAWFPV